MTQLIKYDAACKALAEAKAVDEVKAIHDQSEALRHYSRLAKNRQLEVDAAEIRIRAERRLGQLLNEKKAAGALRGQGERIISNVDSVDISNRAPTLAEIGVTRDLSSRAQKIAAVPDDEFELTLAEHREEQKAVSVRTMKRLTTAGERQKPQQRPAVDALLAAWKAANSDERMAFLVAIGLAADRPALNVWDAYAEAYQARYGVQPVRNAKVNSQLRQLVDRIGADAPAVAAFFVTHNGSWYVSKAHSVGSLLNDAEKLRTEWATQRKVTQTEARQADAKQAQGDVWAKLLEEATHAS